MKTLKHILLFCCCLMILPILTISKSLAAEPDNCIGFTCPSECIGTAWVDISIPTNCLSGGTDPQAYSDELSAPFATCAVDCIATDGSCSSTANDCLAGTAVDLADTGTHYQWKCRGWSGGADSPTCSEIIPVTPTAGTCGTANGVESVGRPTSNLCATGTSGSYTGSGTSYGWKCMGSDNLSNSDDALCSAPPAWQNLGCLADADGPLTCGGVGVNYGCPLGQRLEIKGTTCSGPPASWSTITSHRCVVDAACSGPPAGSCAPDGSIMTWQNAMLGWVATTGTSLNWKMNSTAQNATPVDVDDFATSGVIKTSATTWQCGGTPPTPGSCGGTSNTCSVGTVSNTNAGSCSGNQTWDCVGGGGTANCSLANAACPAVVNGTCGSNGACSTGSPTGDNNLTSCGTTRSWTCDGSGPGHTDDTCNVANAACPAVVNGTCGSNGACSTGSPTGDNNLTSCGTTRSWTCDGSGPGHTDDTCNVANAACPAVVNGTCGSNGACSTGSPTGDNNLTSCGTTRSWTCDGSGPGHTDDTCNVANAACPVGSCGGTSNTCSVGTPTGYAAGSCAGNQTWSCNAAGGNVGCTLANAPCPVAGTCGTANGAAFYSAPSSSLCGSGTPTGVTGSGPWYWDCQGVHTGPTVSCSALLRVDGSCGPANGVARSTTPTSLCSVGGASGVSGGVNTSAQWSWNCSATNGGVVANCNAPMVGTCGSRHGVQGFTGPSSGPQRCATGGETSVTDTGTQFTWSCNGSSAPYTASCSAYKSISGVCGAGNGVATATTPASRCSVGISSAVSGGGLSTTQWSWTCAGVYGGLTPTCRAPLNATCGADNGGNFYEYAPPSSNLCGSGVGSGVTTTTNHTWSCTGSAAANSLPAGANASCAANMKIDGACGTANNKNLATQPAANTLCGAVTASGVTAGAASWTWTCAGQHTGSTASCVARRIINGACGTANGVGTATSPAAGLCSAGTGTAVSGSAPGPWAWSCTGANTGTTATCNAPPPPPAPTFGGACPT